MDMNEERFAPLMNEGKFHEVVAQWLAQQVYPRFPKESVYRWPLKKSKSNHA